MKKWQRTLLIGFIWGFIFLWWFIRGFLFRNWQFDFFSLSGANGWMFLVDEFRKGWVINDTSTIIFFVVALSAWPLYFCGWRYFLKIEWLKLLRRTVNRIIYFFTGGESIISKKKTAPLSLKKKSSKNTRPRALDGSIRPASKESELKVPVEEPSLPKSASSASTPYGYNGNKSEFGHSSSFDSNGGDDFGRSPYVGGKSGHYTPPADSPFNKGFTLPSMEQGFSVAPSPTARQPWDEPNHYPFGDESMEDMLLSDIKLPERVKVEENIPALFDQAGYTVLQNVLIGDKLVEYVAVSETRVIVAVEDTQDGDWLADEERFNGEDPLWFSESSHRISPIFQLLETVKGLMSRLMDNGFSGTVLPMFIERAGVIINAEDMQTTWKDLSVVVCRTDVGGPDELKTVAQSLIPGEKPSTEVVEKVRLSL